jgi:hypothetical protein
MSDIEAQTRRKLRDSLESDFEIHEGWSGRHKHGGEVVKYDLVLVPRTHLVEQGFDDGHAVIEVKMFAPEDKKPHDLKARDLLWQCVAYSFSDILLPDGRYERPLFVLYYIGGPGVDKFHQPEFTVLHHFVQRGGVGLLRFDKYGAWEMRFGGTFYFRKRFGKGPHNVGTKRQTGSSR